MLLGALLAPPLFWILRGLEPWALANGLMKWDPRESNVLINGPLGFITTEFQKCFVRAVPLAALLLAIPAARQLGIRNRRELGLHEDPAGGAHLLRGFLTTAVLGTILATTYVLTNIRVLLDPTPWLQVPLTVFGAAITAAVEQFLFQGVIFGFLRKIARPAVALAWTAVIFAGAHFFKPEANPPIAHVTWLSGFQLLPTLFHDATQPNALLGVFLPLLALGWLTGFPRLRTDALWLSIGLHAGALFLARSLSAVTQPGQSLAPWAGPGLLQGAAALAMLLAALLFIRLRLDHEELLPNRRPSD